jgi:hypothetical protein
VRRGLVVLFLLAVGAASAHESRPAYLEIIQTGPETCDVTWKVPARGNLRLGLYVVFPEGTAATSERTGMNDGTVHIERWSVRRAGGFAGETLLIDGLRTTQTEALIRFQRLDGTTQVGRLLPTSPGMTVAATPTRWQAAGTYIGVGVRHILGGVDHLLFVLGLLFLVRERWMLVKTITSFTVAHSLTLAVATLGWAHAPTATLNVLIALSILFLGPEIVRLHRGETSLAVRHPWVVAFLFGLLHGFGFASGLTELGLPPAEIPLALLMFNVGVEIGQLGFVAILLLAWGSFGVLEFRWRTWAPLAPAYVIGTLGSYWTIDRLLTGLRSMG